VPSSSTPVSDIGTPDSWAGLVLGQTVIGDWFEQTADLMWPTSTYTYARMRHDPQLKAVLQAYLLPILRATWLIDPDGCRDEVVQQTADDLGVGILGHDSGPGPARRRGVIWQRHLKTALYQQLVQGFMPFELRYEILGQRAHLAALGPRMPWSVAMINTNRDGTIASMTQNTQNIPIPANRLVWYVNDMEGSNWVGTSALRACFGAWLLKHETWRTHATSIRRFGMGIPGVEAPPGATANQMAHARQMASAMRAGDTAGMAIPSGFKPFLMGMTGSAPDALGFIEYLDRVMAKQALASLIELGQTETGSRALGDTFMDLFLLSLQAVADEAALTATSGQDGTAGIITDLVDQNWGEDEAAPRIVCTDVGTQYEASSQAIQQLTITGALQPDSNLDEWIRKQWHLPKRNEPWIQPVSKQAPAPNPTQPGGVPGGQPNPASNGPAAPEGGSTQSGSPAAPSGPASAAARNRLPRGAASSVLRRQPTAIEAASGFDAEQHQAAWESALDSLMDSYSGVAAAQKAAIVAQVSTILAADDIGQLASISVALAEGETLLAQAMLGTWQASVNAMAAEALKQGVHIATSKVPTPDFSGVANGRASFAATYMAQQGGSRAMRGVQPGKAAKAQADAVTADVSAFLDDLSSRNLRDHLGGALTAAQNAGRVAVLQAAPASAGTAKYVASEILDVNTCAKCQDEDGHEFESLAAAEGAYPSGGYLHCQGDLRCRGTVVAVWGEQAAAAGGHPKAEAS
jgi:hypothetical protein